MENSLKQRIIGAIVLVALGVIFLPSILKKKTSNGIFESKIPKKPAIIADYKMDTFKIDELLAEENIEAKKILEEAKAIKSKIDNTPDLEIIDEVIVDPKDSKNEHTQSNSQIQIVKKKAKVVSITNEGAWIIQVASFSNKENAKNLVNKLIDKGNKAYKSKATIDNKIVYRVFVGPFIKKQLAKKAITSINKISATKGMLKIFNPLKH
ncbi:MAG: hypothetical protein COB38_03795 [Gammaproteobacteria bacterium]|nr:MAG: hypothetical protein COB38_03795 [Gammaproteobacteria bacterium]